MSDDNLLERARAAIVPPCSPTWDCIIKELIAEVEANRDMLQKFQEHEDQTHAAMEEIFGTSDSFIELARKMKEEVERLRSENERLAKMFAENTYIESAHMEPGFYDINLRGQGAMLLIGHLIQMFRDTGRENFITNTLQMTLPDGKTNELFELTIQKVNGEDSPAMKIKRLSAAFLEAEAAAHYYEECLIIGQSDGPVFFGWPGRKYQAFSDKEEMERHLKAAREALERIKEGKG